MSFVSWHHAKTNSLQRISHSTFRNVVFPLERSFHVLARSQYVNRIMKSHWKSSENPLYVRIIWRKGARHVVLHDEELHVRKRKATLVTPRNEAKPVTTSGENLENCLTKLKLDSKENNLPARAVSCEPTFLRNPVCKVVTRPNYSVNKSYFYVNKLQTDYAPVPSEENIQDYPPDAFTDRILQWLSSSSASVDIISSPEHTIQINRKSPFKERPKTSPGNATKKSANLSEDHVEEIFENEESPEQYGRPQLHVFVPIFESERMQLMRKCKSMDDT